MLLRVARHPASRKATGERSSEARLLTGPDPARGVGAGLRLDADGYLFGDDPRAVAGLPGDGSGHLDGDGDYGSNNH